MSLLTFLLVAFGLLAVTFGGLFVVRIYRESRDAALTEVSGGWKIRSQLPISLGDPYNRFDALFLAQPSDIMEGNEDGFAVSYFEATLRHRGARRPCAIVQLPVEGPRLDMTEGERVPPGVGPRTADVLASLAGVGVKTAPFALFVRSVRASRETVDRTAMRLAKAIVADAEAEPAGPRS